MTTEQTHKWEQGIIHLLNLDGWQLEWTGGDYEHYDAKGKTPKGFNCILEIKIRNEYYPTKLLEKFKYDHLMSQKNCLKFYYVFDTKGNYLYFLDQLKIPELNNVQAGATTYSQGNKNKVNKSVYMLTESQAVIINKNTL
jgi:hypothetical protein